MRPDRNDLMLNAMERNHSHSSKNKAKLFDKVDQAA